MPQALFAAVVCVFCLAAPYVVRQAGRLRRRLRGRALCGLADDLGVDGPCHRRDQPPRSVAGRDQEAPGCDAGRLRRHLHLRHGRLGDRPCADRPGAAWHRSRGGVQALRGEARRQEGSGRAGTAWHQFELARVPRPGRRTGGRQDGAGSRGAGARAAGVRPAHPAWRPDHGGDRRHGDPGGRRRGRRRPARGAGQPDRRRQPKKSTTANCWRCRSKVSMST